MEAAAKIAEHFAAGHFGGCRKIVDADLPANQSDHLAMTRCCSVWKISYVDRQQIHRSAASNSTQLAANDRL